MSIIFGNYTPPNKVGRVKDLTIGIFFDGTNNNKNNTKAKEYFDKRVQGEKLTHEETISAEAYRKQGRDKKTVVIIMTGQMWQGFVILIPRIKLFMLMVLVLKQKNRIHY